MANPLRYTDPTGQCPWCVGAAIGGIAGAVSASNSGATGWAIAGAAVAGVAGGAFGAFSIGALGSASAYWSTVAAGGFGGLIGNVGGQIAGGTSLSNINKKQAATQCVIGAVSGGWGYVYAVGADSAVVVPTLSAATSGAINTWVNVGVPTSWGGLRP